MKSKCGLLSVMFITIAIRLFAQEVSTASIIVDGQRSTIRFTNINGEAFVSWLDLAKLMPRILSLSAKGEIIATTTNAGQPSVEDLLRAMGSASAPTGDAIESRIDGEFTGQDGDTIFKLMNGQIWQQEEYAYTYTYKYMPGVTIYRASSGWKMKVDGMDKDIRVRRIKQEEPNKSLELSAREFVCNGQFGVIERRVHGFSRGGNSTLCQILQKLSL